MIASRKYGKATFGTFRIRSLLCVAALAALDKSKRLQVRGAYLALRRSNASASYSDLTLEGDDARVSILPLTIAVRLRGGILEPLLGRGMALPATVHQDFTTTVDDQEIVKVGLFLGERPFSDNAIFLGQAELSPAAKRSNAGFVKLRVSLNVSTSGAVQLEVVDMDEALVGKQHLTKLTYNILTHLDVVDKPELERELEVGAVARFDEELAEQLPMLRPVRVVSLLGRNIVLRQLLRRGTGATGGSVWASALVLAKLVADGSMHSVRVGARVLELGAGSGLVAMAAALKGADVVASDVDEVALRGLEANVAACERSGGPMNGRISTDCFDWSSQLDRQRIQGAGPWDCVLGSDLLYPGNVGEVVNPSNRADNMLLETLHAVVGPTTRVVLVLHNRAGEVQRFCELIDSQRWHWSSSLAHGHTHVYVLKMHLR